MFNLFAAYFISWLLFAIVWYIIGLIHGKIRIIPKTHAYIYLDISGDFDLESQESDHVVCVENVVDFTSAFLFSVETQHTIG